MITGFKKYADKFEQYQKIRNLDRRTVSETQRKLSVFFNYLDQQGITDIDQITTDIIKLYQIEQYQYLNKQGRQNSVRYQNSMVSVVRRFLKYLRESGYIASDPSRDIQYAKAPQMLPRSIMTESESKRILHAPDTKSVLGYRDRTILEVFYSTGIRKSELANLKLGDVDYHDGFLRINQGKGKKDRVVPIGRICCRYVENYMNAVRPTLIKDPCNDYLFLSIRGNKINRNSLWKLVKKYAKKSRIRKNVHCHTFRHTCATTMLKNKADIRMVQELLGHSSLDSTQVYTHLTITDLKDAHRRYHPRERDNE